MDKYFRVPNKLFDTKSDLSASEKLVFVYLCRVTNSKPSGWSSYTTIADKCGITRRTAIRSIKKLLILHYIQIRRNNTANLYRVCGDK